MTQACAGPSGAITSTFSSTLCTALATAWVLRARSGQARMLPLLNIASKVARMADGAHHPRPAGVDADDVVVVRPASHELVDVAVLQRAIEGVLDVVGSAFEIGGLEFVFLAHVPEDAILPWIQRWSHCRTAACRSPWAARQTVSGAAIWMPGGASCKATATNCATLAARTGCSLLGTMYLQTDSIQCGECRKQARRRRGRRLLRRPDDQQALEAQRRHGLLVEVGETTLQGFGQPALGMRQHDGQGVGPAAPHPLRHFEQLPGRGRPQRPLAVVEQARRIEQDDPEIGGRGGGHSAGGHPATDDRGSRRAARP